MDTTAIDTTNFRIIEAYDPLNGWRAVNHDPDRDGDVWQFAHTLVEAYRVQGFTVQTTEHEAVQFLAQDIDRVRAGYAAGAA